MTKYLLSVLPTAANGLMFASTAVKKQWDTWGFVENGTWFDLVGPMHVPQTFAHAACACPASHRYAYYLITEVSPGEGFGVATSTDGQHL